MSKITAEQKTQLMSILDHLPDFTRDGMDRISELRYWLKDNGWRLERDVLLRLHGIIVQHTNAHSFWLGMCANHNATYSLLDNSL